MAVLHGQCNVALSDLYGYLPSFFCASIKLYSLLTATFVCELISQLQLLCESNHLGNHTRPLSLAIPPWIGAVNTGNGFVNRWGRNGEFCIAVGPAIRTAGMQA